MMAHLFEGLALVSSFLGLFLARENKRLHQEKERFKAHWKTSEEKQRQQSMSTAHWVREHDKVREELRSLKQTLQDAREKHKRIYKGNFAKRHRK